MKYKFPQFQVEVKNPTVEIDMNTIGDKAIDKLLSVDVVLSTPTAKFGVRAEDMPYDPTWEDASIPDMVAEWLKQYQSS
jgi:hypothetical protein